GEGWQRLQRAADRFDATGADEQRARRAAGDQGRFTRNFVVQGTAAEWALAWLADLRQRLARLPAIPTDGESARPAAASGPVFSRRAHLVFFLHDEVIVHAPAEQADHAAEAIRAAAASAGRLLFGDAPVDFPLDLSIGARTSKDGAGSDEPFRVAMIDRRTPRADDVVIDIRAAGICHSGIPTIRSGWGRAHFPLTVGHAIAGVVEAVGSDVTDGTVGDRVGVGCRIPRPRRCSTSAPSSTPRASTTSRRSEAVDEAFLAAVIVPQSSEVASAAKTYAATMTARRTMCSEFQRLSCSRQSAGCSSHVHPAERLLMGTSRVTDMITLSASSAPAVSDKPAETVPQEAAASPEVRMSEAKYQKGIMRPISRALSACTSRNSPRGRRRWMRGTT